MAVAGKTVAAGGAGLVLLTLASGQFLMTLDSSVMNVSIATVASDLNTTVSGIQSAITLYTLVMATLMITGGKIGANIGRRRAFSIGCIILRHWIADDSAGAEPGHIVAGLVAAGRHRRRADHARRSWRSSPSTSPQPDAPARMG